MKHTSWLLFCHKLESDTVHQDRIKWKNVKVVDAQSCPALCDPMDCSPPGSSVHGILQARILEQVTIPFSRESSRPRDQTPVSWIARRFFTVWATREAQNKYTSNPGARRHVLPLTPHPSQFNQHADLTLGEAPHTKSPAKGWVPTQCEWSPPALQQWAGRTAGHMELDFQFKLPVPPCGTRRHDVIPVLTSNIQARPVLKKFKLHGLLILQVPHRAALPRHCFTYTSEKKKKRLRKEKLLRGNPESGAQPIGPHPVRPQSRGPYPARWPREHRSRPRASRRTVTAAGHSCILQPWLQLDF